MLLFLLFVFSLYSTFSLTNAICSESYLDSFNSVKACIPSAIDFPSSDIDIEEFGGIVELEDCISSNNKQTCDSILENYSVTTNDVLSTSIIAHDLIDSPESTCSCITQFMDASDTCVQPLDQFLVYCNFFVLSDADLMHESYTPSKRPTTRKQPSSVFKKSPSQSSASSLRPVDRDVLTVPTSRKNQTVFEDFPHSSCSASVHEVCNITEPSFRDMLKCMKSNSPALGDSCTDLADSTLATIYSSCKLDVVVCEFTKPSEVLACLLDNKTSLSRSCREEIDGYLQDDLPCVRDAERFCAEFHTVSTVMACLEYRKTTETLQDTCVAMLDGLEICHHSKERKQTFYTGSSSDRDAEYGTRENASAKDKPKPGPPASDSKMSPKPEPADTRSKPGPAQNKPKPGPADTRSKPGPPHSRRSLRQAGTSELPDTVDAAADFDTESRQYDVDWSPTETTSTAAIADDATLPCWARQKQSSQHSDDDAYDGLSSEMAALAREQELLAEEESAVTKLLYVLGIIVSMLSGLMLYVWYQNGFAVNSYFNAGYWRAPTFSESSSHTTVEMAPSGADDVSTVVLASAYFEK